MERPHTLTRSSFLALPAEWSLGRVLAWICLLVVVSTSIYGLQRAGALMLPSAVADQLDESHKSLSSTGVVVIAGQNTRTGDRIQVECMTASDRIANDSLLVDFKDLDEVAAMVCNVASAPAVRR